MRGRTAIVGIGESDLGRVPGRNALDLMAQAARESLDDAGLTFSDIDGIVTMPVRVAPMNPPAGLVASALGVRPRWLSTVDLAGASGTAMIDQAALAICAGHCDTVLCVAGQNLLSNKSRGAAVQGMAESGVAHLDFEVPQGALVASLYALVASQHMARFGTTERQMAEVAVAMRANAALNARAHKKSPITIDDVLQSRPISTPLKMLDCSLVSDGGAAIVVTSLERAKHMRRAPTVVLGTGYGQRHGYIGETADIVSTGAVESGKAAYRQARLGPSDIDVAELYDCFTITVIVELEDLGFCPKGEGGRFVEGGRLRFDGDFPTTTHGGLLSACHSGLPGGLFHVVEAVRQLRGEAGARQVRGAEVALVHGNGGVIAVHCSLVLGAAHTV